MLDDFGEGFGMAQAISYVDPHLLTYMALEERLAQAMEVEKGGRRMEGGRDD